VWAYMYVSCTRPAANRHMKGFTGGPHQQCCQSASLAEQQHQVAVCRRRMARYHNWTAPAQTTRVGYKVTRTVVQIRTQPESSGGM
jgi:hypothetical protein